MPFCHSKLVQYWLQAFGKAHLNIEKAHKQIIQKLLAIGIVFG